MRTVDIESCNIAFVDPSTSCTGYCIISTDLESGIARIRQSGFLKWPAKTNRALKLGDIYALVSDYFYSSCAVDLVVYEEFYFNQANAQGGMAVAECIGAIKAACYSDMVSLQLDSVNKKGETTWKKGLLGKGKVEKEETKQYLQDRFPGKIPDMVLNPVSGRSINIPNDLTDALAIGLFYVEKMGFKKIVFDAEIEVKKTKKEKKEEAPKKSRSIVNFLKLLRNNSNAKVMVNDLIEFYDCIMSEEDMIIKIKGEVKDG